MSTPKNATLSQDSPADPSACVAEIAHSTGRNGTRFSTPTSASPTPSASPTGSPTVETRTVTATRKIPYKTRKVKDPTLAAGKYPIMVSGSWWFGRLNKEVTTFKLGQFTFPGNTLNPGSSGNLLVIPKNAKNKDLAAKFIDATLGKTAQNTSAQLGGLPVAGDSSVITDENTKTLQQNFDSVVKNDGLAFYPDWPVPGFYDQLVSFGQSIVNGSKSPTDALTALGQYYDSGRKDLTGK